VDIPRAPKPKRPPWLIIGGIVGLVVLTVGFSRLRPAAPTVDRSTLWIGRGTRGPMLRQVRGNGSLVPEQIRWISSVTAGRIERIFVRAGAQVEPNTVLLEMSNPDVQLEALDADRQLNLAEANLASLESNLKNSELSQEGVVASTHTEFMDAKRAVDAADKLASQGLISGNEVDRARDKMAEMQTRWETEKQRLDVVRTTTKTQLQLQRDQVSRLKAISSFHHGRVASMTVTAGARGTLQDLSLEEGQWVNPGALLAKVAQPERLKAVLRVPETQARDVQIGQSAQIDTHNGMVSGHVIRTDPSVQNGTVAVDVGLEGTLPKGARPDLSVDGVVEIERLKDVLSVNRPVDAQPNATIGLFKLTDGGKEAVRVNVQIGRTSVNAIEILGGLAQGDDVILSDMSRWDGDDRVRIR